MSPRSIQLLFACDRAFLPHVATTIRSALVSSPVGAQVHLINSGATETDLARLGAMVTDLGSHLVTYRVDADSLEHLKTSLHVSVAAYYRLLAPELLPVDVTRVLYLDSDVIVLKSLAQLWDTDMLCHSVAAVENPGFADHSRLGMPTGAKYLNSGVMVVDLAAWRDQGVAEKALAFAEVNPDRVKLWDQDALNAVLRGAWRELPTHWNVQSKFFMDPALRAEHRAAVLDPSIVHFSGMGTKPWQYGVSHPYKKAYRLHRRRTPWPRYREEGAPSFLGRALDGLREASRLRRSWNE